jgi:hypothetical protein
MTWMMPLAAVAVALAAGLGLAAPSSAVAGKPTAQELSHDGLEASKQRGLDQIFVRPGASLAGYKRIQLDDVDVAFAKYWEPVRTGSTVPIKAEDREQIRAHVAKLVRDQFAKDLQAKSGYPLATAPGPDVLRVKARIIDLTLAVPELRESSMTRIYAMSAGEMTLVAELFDSETGQVLARAVDRREGRNVGQMVRITPQETSAQIEEIASTWARILRERLDQAKAASSPK